MPYSHFSQFFFWNKLRKSTFSVCYVLNVQSTMMYYYVWLSSFWSHFYKKVRKYFFGWVVGTRPGKEWLSRENETKILKNHTLWVESFLYNFFCSLHPPPSFFFSLLIYEKNYDGHTYTPWGWIFYTCSF